MTQAIFKFISDAPGGDQFTVVSFSGFEAISRLYQYKIEIKASDSVSIELDDILDFPAHFITELDAQSYPVDGVLSSIEEFKRVPGYVYYRVVLVPRLWWLSVYKTNQIYTATEPGTTIDLIISEILDNAGPDNAGIDYDISDLDTKTDFLQRDYRCQFGESDFDFISRLMENEGIFYYFEHDGIAEKIIFVNDRNYASIASADLTFEMMAQSSNYYDTVQAWSCRKQRLPRSFMLKDYNSLHPSLAINSESLVVDQQGPGIEYSYGDYIKNDVEADTLSNIRYQESLCNKTRFYGESGVTRLQAGYSFNLNHPVYDGRYLTVEVNHEGQQLDRISLSKRRSVTPSYNNSFVAIDVAEQFRPARVTAKPRFYGTMTAFIHASQGTNDIEIGDQNIEDQAGRYLVHIPFDRTYGIANNDSDDMRKTTAWIRMAQPSAGVNQGTYFPLKAGTEVLLTFLNGDPDRPVITAALPNTDSPSLLNAANDTEAVIQSAGQNRITLKDSDGIEDERLVIQSPTENSSLRLGGMDKGASSDTFSLPQGMTETDGIQLRTDKDFVLSSQRDNKLTADANNEIKSTGAQNKISALSRNSISAGSESSIQTAVNDYEAEVSASGSTLARNFLYSEGETKVVTGKDYRVKSDEDCHLEASSGFYISAYDSSIKIEMKSDKLLIDSGSIDMEINCNSLTVDNESESNVTWGNDFALHGGAAESIFLGESFEFYLGIKQEITIAGTFEFFGGVGIEVFAGAKFDFFGGFAMEGFLGYKVDMAFAGVLEVADVVKIEKGPGEQKLEFIGGQFKLDGADIADGKVRIRSGLLAIFA